MAQPASLYAAANIFRCDGVYVVVSGATLDCPNCHHSIHKWFICLSCAKLRCKDCIATHYHIPLLMMADGPAS